MAIPRTFPPFLAPPRALVLAALVAFVACGSPAVAQITWTGGGANGNWNTGANWSGGVAPGATGATLVFDTSNNLTGTNDLPVTSVNGITYLATAGAFNTAGTGTLTIAGNVTNNSANVQTLNMGVTISSGQTTTVGSGAVMAFGSTGSALNQTITGSAITVTLTGAGEARYLTNSTGAFTVATTAANSATTTLDASGLAVFTANVGTFRVGPSALATGTGTTIMRAAATTSITASTLNIGWNSTNSTNGSDDSLLLGTSGTINATTIQMGQARSKGTLKFDTGLTNPAVTIRGSTGGASKANLSIGQYNGGNTGSTGRGVADFTLGSVDAALGTVQLGYMNATQGTGSPRPFGAWLMSSGTVTADVVRLGYWPSSLTSGSMSGSALVSGTLSISGGSFTVGSLRAGDRQAGPMTNSTGTCAALGIVNVSGGSLTVTGTFRLGDNTGGGVASDQRGTLTITGGTVSSSVAITSTNAQSTLTLNGGTLDMQGNAIGSASQQIGSNGGALNFQAGTLLNVSEINGGGAFTVTKTGTGRLYLAGTNTWTGTTAASAGSLVITSTAALPGWNTAGRWSAASGAVLGVTNAVDDASAGSLAATGNFAAGSYLGFDTSAGDRTVATALAGVQGLSKAGGNTLTLSATNSYSGPTAVTGGTLSVSSDANLGTAPGSATPGQLVINGGVLSASAGFTLDANRGIAVGGTSASGTGTINVAAGTLAYGGVIANNTSGTGSLLKTGAGVLSLSGANTYTGSTIVGGGTLAVAGNQTLAGALVFGATQGDPTVGGVDLTSASGTFGGLTLQGYGATAGTTGTNVITIGSGQTLATNGNVAIGVVPASGGSQYVNLNVAGSSPGVGAWMVTNTQAGGLFQVGASNTAAGFIAKVDLSGLGVFSANVSSGTFRVGGTGGWSNSTPFATLTLATSSTISARTIGVGDLAGQNQLNTLYLGSGAQRFNTDLLAIGVNSTSSNRGSGAVQFAGATGSLVLRGTGGDASRANVNMLNGLATTSNISATLDLRAHDADLLVGTLSMLTTTGSTLGVGNPGTSTFSFDQGTFNATTLLVGSRGVSGTTATSAGTATVNLGSSGNSAVNTSTIGSISMAAHSGTVTSITGVMNIAGANTTVGVTGSWTVASNFAAATGGTSSGTVNISGGTVTANSGIILRSGSGFGSVSGELSITGGSLTSGSTITTSGTFAAGVGSATLTLAGGLLDMGGYAIGGLNQRAITTNFQSGTLQGVSELNGGGAFTKTTTGTLVLQGTNSWTGSTAINAGVLEVGGSNSLGGSGTISFGGGTLRYSAGNQVDYSARIKGSSSSINIATNSQTVTFASAIDSTNTGGLNKTLPGTLILSATDSGYTGNTLLTQGTVQVMKLADTGAVSSLGASGTIRLNGGSLNYRGTGDFSNRPLALGPTVQSGGTGALNGTIVANGSGALSLSGVVDLGTFANGGRTLTLGGTNADLNTFASTLNDGLSIFSLTKSEAGRWQISGANTYTGSTTITAGTLVAGNTSAFGTGPLVVNSGTVDLAGFNVSIGPLSGSSGGVITTSGAAATLSTNVPAGSAAFAGVIQDGAAAVGLTKLGAGTLTLTAAQTYTGDTIIKGGTLALGAGGSFANSARIVVGDSGSSGAVLDLTQSGSLTIGPAQVLQGKGTVAMDVLTAVLVEGLFSPGNSPDLFTYDGGGTVTLSGTTLMEIWGTTRGANPGYDAVDVLNGTTLNLGGLLHLDFDQNYATDTSFLLFDTATTGTLASGFTGVTITGSNTDYTGLTFAQSGNVWTTDATPGGQALRVTQTDSQVTLVVIAVAVPEPGTLALAGIGLAAAGWTLRRQRGRRADEARAAKIS